MISAKPIVALLWENWRLTRIEAGQRLALGIVLGSAALTMSGSGAIVAFWILFALHAVFCLSIAKLNGGRFMDGYKPGFPFYLLHASRPDDRVRRRRHGVRRDLCRGWVPRIRGSSEVCLRPAAPVASCGPVDRGLPPCLHLHPMVDPKQSRPVDWIDRHHFAGLLSA